MKFTANTPLIVYAKTSNYVKGEGQTSEWTAVGKLYCEWRGTFGDRLLTAASLGVTDSATVRTYYHPKIYEALRAQQCIIAKNADMSVLKNGLPDKNNPNAYELWSGVDNVQEANLFMEFRVRRYEGK